MGLTCDIFAHRVRNGRVTNEISTLHKDLLWLGKIALKFTRWRANRVFYLASSKKFTDSYKDELVFDENGEPILPSLYKIIPEAFGSDVTNEDIRMYLQQPFDNEINDVGASFVTALERIKKFNKQLKGAGVYIATLEDRGDGRYNIKVEYNTKDVLDKLIQTIVDMLTANLLITRLSSKDTPIKVIEGLNSTLTLYGGARFIQGVKGVITLSGTDNNTYGLAKMTGLTIALIMSDNNLVKRLYKVIQELPLVIATLLGDERYEEWNNSLKTEEDIRALIGEFIGYYLEHYTEVAPKGIVLNIYFLLGKIMDYFKTHFKFKIRERDFSKALYQAKYDSWKLASSFMKGDLQKKFSDKLSYKLDTNIRNASFKSILDSVKRFGLLTEKVKKINGKLYKEFHDLFGTYMKSLTEGIIEYNQTVLETLLNGGASSNIFNSVTMDEQAASVYANMAEFIALKISTGIDLLLKLYDPTIELTMSEKASIIDLNQLLYNMANHIQAELRRINVQNEELKAQLAEMANQLSNIIHNSNKITLEEKVHNIDGSETTQMRTRILGSFKDLILDARKALCLDLLLRINGSKYLSIEKYVTVGDKGWFSVTRHKQAVKDLSKELEETDINPGYSFFSRYIDSMADSPDIMNQMVYDIVEEEKHKANVRTLTTREKLRRMYQHLENMEWVDTNGTKRKGGINMKMFYEVYYSTDDNGNIIRDKKTGQPIMTEALTGNFMSERNWGEWEKQKAAYMRMWEEEFWDKSFTYQTSYGEFKYGDTYTFNGVVYTYNKNGTIEQKEEYRRHFHDFVNTLATITALDYYYKRDMYDDYSYLTEYGLAKEEWHSRNSVKINLKNSDGNEVINDLGKIVLIWAPAISTDPASENYEKLEVYDNPQYKWLKLEGNENLLAWYNEMLRIKQQLDEKLPPGSTLPFGLRAPLFMGTVTNRLRNSLGNGGGAEFSKTIMNHIWYGIRESPDDIEFGGENNTYNQLDLYDGKGTLIYDREYVNALNAEQRLPVYGVRKLKNMNELSTDMVHSILAYTAMADNYDCLDDVVGAIEQLRTQLYDRKVDGVYTIRERETKDTPSTYARLLDYMKMLVYNDYNGLYGDRKRSKWVRKVAGKLSLSSSLYFLGGNIHSAITNGLTATSQLISEAWAGTDFGVADLAITCVNFIGWKTISLAKQGANLFTEKGSYLEDRSKFTLWKRRFNIQNTNESDFRDMHIATKGYSVFGGYSYSEISMLPYSIVDEWMQTIAFMASARALKLTKIGVKQKDGTIKGQDLSKKKSLWDLYTVDKKTGQLVCSDGEFEEWGIQNKNLLSTREYFLNSEEGLLEEEEVLFLKSFTDADGNELDPSESPAWTHWDLQLENRFRLKCRGINNRLNGIYNRGDGGAILGMIVGPLILSLKKYAIGMFDRRFARARYDYRTKRMRQGSTTTFLNLFVDLVISKDVSDLDDLSWYESKAVIRLIYGLLNLMFMYFASIFHAGALGNDYRRKYLEKRGYSAEQIANIDRTTAEWMNIAFTRIIIGLALPPEDDEDINLDELADIWGGGDLLYFLYRFFLNHSPGHKTIDDEYNLDKENLTNNVLDRTGIAPFSFRGMVLYLAYRTLREQEAYDIVTTILTGKGGIFTEYRNLTESFLPSFAALEDALKLLKAIRPVILTAWFNAGLTYEEWYDLPTKEAEKYDYSLIEDVDKAYGAQIYKRGNNREWYKYATGLLRVTPLVRSGKIYYDPLTAINNMEYAVNSDLFSEMKKFNRKNWKGWVNTALGVGLFNDIE